MADAHVITRLSAEEQRNFGANTRITYSYTDVIALTDNTATACLSVKAGQGVDTAFIVLETPFDGGSTSDLTLTVGDGIDPDRFIDVTAIHTDGTEILYFDQVHDTIPYTYLADDTIDVIFDVSGAAITTLTSGLVHIFLNITDRRKLKTTRPNS